MNSKNISNVGITQTVQVNETANKKIYIELLRCIAILFVVFNHTSTYGYQLYTLTNNNFLKIIYMIFSIVCKCAVPIFFMISGGLLLGKSESLTMLYKKRVLRIFLVIIFASFGQYLFKIRNSFETFNLITFIKTIYTSPINTPYWFLYSYMTFLIILPFLRNMVKNMPKQSYYYLFGIYILYKLILPVIAQLFRINITSYLKVYFLEINILCPIIGFFCEKVLDYKKINKKIIAVFTVILLVILSISIVLTILEIDKTKDQKVQTYIVYGSVYIGMYIYVLIKMIFSNTKFPKWLSKTITLVGSCSFGTYLLEQTLRLSMLKKMMKFLTIYIPTFPACILTVLCIVGIGTLITFLLKKIPYVKKLI